MCSGVPRVKLTVDGVLNLLVDQRKRNRVCGSGMELLAGHGSDVVLHKFSIVSRAALALHGPRAEARTRAVARPRRIAIAAKE